MAGFETGTKEHRIRSPIWSAKIEQALAEEPMSMRFTRIISDIDEAFLGPILNEMLVLANPVSLPVAVAMGAAAVLIKNPVVSRRFWSKS